MNIFDRMNVPPASITEALSGQPTKRDDILGRIRAEVDRAYGKHGREPWGRHEFYGVIKEEVDELWDAIKTDRPQEEVEKEAIQVAAMVLRYLETGDRYRKESPDAR